ncbi:MAG TPA: hypothetical protein VF192_04905 [Longimicrobiales bacterium]
MKRPPGGQAGRPAAVRVLAAAGVAGLLLLLAGALADPRQAAFSYLTAYAYVLTLALGALFFLMIQRAIGATWSIVLRRIAERVAGALPLLTALFIPVLLAWPRLFPWLDDAAPQAAGPEAAYLAPSLAALRAAAYFAVWNAAAALLLRWSLRQDAGGPAPAALARRQRILAAAGLPAVAFAFTFAAFDWLMSLTPGWASTIFGVYLYAGAMVGFLSLLSLLALRLERQGPLAGIITVSHYHALGKLLFTFLVFWAYAAFAQLLLIWIADLPREATWFVTRSAGSWAAVSALLVAGHFLAPFFALLSRELKRRPAALAAAGAWLLAMHYVDVYWIVMPALHPAGIRPHWLDAAALAGLAGSTAAFAFRRARGAPAVARGDPEYRRSLGFSTS